MDRPRGDRERGCGLGRFVWVDTPCTEEATERVYEWLVRTFDEPNVIEINTGFHNDNLGGNGYLIGWGVVCYGSDVTPGLIERCWAQTVRKVLPYFEVEANDKYRDILMNQNLVAPNRLYPLAEGRLLYGGCMIKARGARTPGFVGDADMAAWPVSLGKLLERYPETRLVVPGHGAWGDLSLVRHTIEVCERYNRGQR